VCFAGKHDNRASRSGGIRRIVDEPPPRLLGLFLISPAQALLIVFRFWRTAGPPSPFFTAFVMYYMESDIVNYLLLQNHNFYCRICDIQYKKESDVVAGCRNLGCFPFFCNFSETCSLMVRREIAEELDEISPQTRSSESNRRPFKQRAIAPKEGMK
jgi:hypothetical protein